MTANSPTYGFVQTCPGRSGPGHVGPIVAVTRMPDPAAGIGGGTGLISIGTIGVAIGLGTGDGTFVGGASVGRQLTSAIVKARAAKIISRRVSIRMAVTSKSDHILL